MNVDGEMKRNRVDLKNHNILEYKNLSKTERVRFI